MPSLNVRSLQAKTQTISVYTRHTSDCSKKDDPHWKRCECVKYIYLLRDGKNKTISRRHVPGPRPRNRHGRSGDSWDPVKQKLRELEELQQAQEVGEVTIVYALERWLATVKVGATLKQTCLRLRW